MRLTIADSQANSLGVYSRENGIPLNRFIRDLLQRVITENPSNLLGGKSAGENKNAPDSSNK